MLNVKLIKNAKKIQIPFIKQFSYDTNIKLNRNQTIKDLLFYHIVGKDDCQTYCFQNYG